MIMDQTGRWVVNPFAMRLLGPDEAIQSLVELNFHFPTIKALVSQHILDLENTGRSAHAEKWRYFEEFVTGSVLKRLPQLKQFW